MTTSKKNGAQTNVRPIIVVSILSMLVCGLAFPFLVTGIAQATLPYQANGEITKLHCPSNSQCPQGNLSIFTGQGLGSNLVAQTFSEPYFFQARNDSASGVDPDISVQDALHQAQRIHLVTGIGIDELTSLITAHQEWTLWVAGDSYVNVFQLNIALIEGYPNVYPQYY